MRLVYNQLQKIKDQIRKTDKSRHRVIVCRMGQLSTKDDFLPLKMTKKAEAATALDLRKKHEPFMENQSAFMRTLAPSILYYFGET